MSDGNDFTMAMFNKGSFEGALEAKESWKAYAKKLEKKCIELRASDDAESSLVTEILDEIANEKPRVLSDLKNKPARDAFREKAKRLSEVKLVGTNPLSL